jgi:hypothetical protein
MEVIACSEKYIVTEVEHRMRDDGTNSVEIPATMDRSRRSIGFDFGEMGVRYLAERVHPFD